MNAIAAASPQKGIEIEQIHASVEVLLDQLDISLAGVRDEALEECLREASWELQRALGSLRYAREAIERNPRR